MTSLRRKSLARAAAVQKHYYNMHTEERVFHQGDLVWLFIPTARKLDPQWEGGWTIQVTLGP